MSLIPNKLSQLWPQPGASSDEAKKGYKNMEETLRKVYATASLVSSTDYLVLPFSGESINLKAGNVLSVLECEITLEEGMTYNDLELFFQKEYG